MMLAQVMGVLSTVTAPVAIVLACLVLYGWLRQIVHKGQSRTVIAMVHWASATALYILGRSLYWTMTPVLLGEEQWSRWVEFTGGRAINCVFHAIAIYAFVRGLQLLYLTIDESDRHKYNWLTAPFYPPRFSRRKPIE